METLAVEVAEERILRCHDIYRDTCMYIHHSRETPFKMKEIKTKSPETSVGYIFITSPVPSSSGRI